MALRHKCCYMLQFPQVLPLSLLFITLLAFLIAYAWSVELKYVYDVFPYISDAGGKQPVSCVFGQLLNISAVIAFIIMYLRFKVVANADVTQTRKLYIWNNCSLVMAFISVLGLSMVGNFQVASGLVKVHLVGAFMVFFVGLLYSAVSCIISYMLKRQGMGTALMCHTRLVITISVAFFFVTTMVTAGIAQHQWQSEGSNHTRFNWEPSDPGFEVHVVSTFSEWLMGLMFLIFFLTYYDELSKITVNVKVKAKESTVFRGSHEEFHDDVPGYA